MRHNKLFCSVEILAMMLLLNSCVNVPGIIERMSFGDYKIRVVDSVTNEPIRNISISHCLVYNSYDFPIDMCGNGWFQVFINDYTTDDNGEVIIPKSKIRIYKSIEMNFFTNEIFIVNMNSNKKKQLNYITISPKECNSKGYNSVISEYQLGLDEYSEFDVVNKQYLPVIIDYEYEDEGDSHKKDENGEIDMLESHKYDWKSKYLEHDIVYILKSYQDLQINRNIIIRLKERRK